MKMGERRGKDYLRREGEIFYATYNNDNNDCYYYHNANELQ